MGLSNLKANKKTVSIAVVVLLIIAVVITGIVVLINESRRIRSSDYEIEISPNDWIYVRVQKTFHNMKHLEIILSDVKQHITENEWNEQQIPIDIITPDYRIKLSWGRSWRYGDELIRNNFFEAHLNDALQDNIGTVNDPRSGETNTEKLKELRIFLEEYNSKAFSEI
ncbi:MAG: hypothetical protein FWG70_08115 [Oscillospiraceae bacterium]|nr:hypothetical protein [Oscillospiraceae bacterium]